MANRFELGLCVPMSNGNVESTFRLTFRQPGPLSKGKMSQLGGRDLALELQPRVADRGKFNLVLLDCQNLATTPRGAFNGFGSLVLWNKNFSSMSPNR